LREKEKAKMKKLTCLLLCVLLVCFTAAPALADVIWEPYEDSFYAKHSGECKSVSSNYIVNSPTDSVTVYESPLSETQKSVFNNGATIYIGYTWTDTAGKVWGVVEYEDSANGIPNSVWYNGDTGWLDMAGMVRMYNANDFWTDTRLNSLPITSLRPFPQTKSSFSGHIRAPAKPAAASTISNGAGNRTTNRHTVRPGQTKAACSGPMSATITHAPAGYVCQTPITRIFP
jgi:hypothetical protein